MKTKFAVIYSTTLLNINSDPKLLNCFELPFHFRLCFYDSRTAHEYHDYAQGTTLF